METPQRFPMRWSALLITVTVLGLTNCDGTTPVDIFDIQGVVVGTVRSSTGVPVAGAVVKGTAAYPLVSSVLSVPDSTQTGAAGEFALHFQEINLQDADAPVTLQVKAPVTSGLLDADTSGVIVRIARADRHTTRVEVTLLEYQPVAEHLVGEFSGRGGENFKAYDLFLAIDEVSDSVRGLWSLFLRTTCATHDGQF